MEQFPIVDGSISGEKGMKPKKTVNNTSGGEFVEQYKTVRIDNISYEVSRVFAGKQTSRDLLKCQLLANAEASLTTMPSSKYNVSSRLVIGKEVT